jgi:hypothetical protein
VAGPFLPAAVQTIFYQSQTVIIYLINTQVFRNQVLWYPTLFTPFISPVKWNAGLMCVM